MISSVFCAHIEFIQKRRFDIAQETYYTLTCILKKITTHIFPLMFSFHLPYQVNVIIHDYKDIKVYSIFNHKEFQTVRDEVLG